MNSGRGIWRKGLAVQDTTSLNYDTHEKTEGIGYISDKTKGVNIHSCIAVTPDGLVHGVLDQTHYNRPRAKDDTMTAEVKKNRPVEEKESNRWLVMTGRVCRNIPDEIRVKPCAGRINTVIPRDSRHAAKAARIPGHKTNIIARRDYYA